jgi:hypothetical protein
MRSPSRLGASGTPGSPGGWSPRRPGGEVPGDPAMGRKCVPEKLSATQLKLQIPRGFFRGRGRQLPARRQPHEQPARTALPQHPSGSATTAPEPGPRSRTPNRIHVWAERPAWAARQERGRRQVERQPSAGEHPDAAEQESPCRMRSEHGPVDQRGQTHDEAGPRRATAAPARPTRPRRREGMVIIDYSSTRGALLRRPALR